VENLYLSNANATFESENVQLGELGH